MGQRGPFVLSLEETADGGVRVALGGDSAIEAELDPAQAAGLWNATALLPMRHESMPDLPGVLRRWDREEEEVGQRMGRALEAAGQVMPSLLAALRAAEVAERDPTQPMVLLQLSTPRLRALPWELIGLGAPSVRLASRAVIARLSPAETLASHSGPRLRHLLYTSESPSERPDEVIQAFAQGIAAAAAERDTPVVPLPLGGWPSPARPTLDVLHIAIHGHLRDSALYVETRPEEWVSVIAFSEAIATAARQAALVVLWSCHGAGQDHDALDTLAGRLAAVGARAVLAPTVEIPARWARPWVRGFETSLLGGAPLLEAAWEARRALAIEQRAEVMERTRNLRLLLGTDDPRVNGRLCWLPPGWPTVRVDLATLIGLAWDLARRRGSGFVGAEHLIGAIAEADHGLGPMSDAAVQELRPRIDAVLGTLSAWSPAVMDADPQPTPRLLSWGQELQPGADPAALWALSSSVLLLLLEMELPDPHATLRTLYDPTRTLDSGRMGVAPPLDPPTRLEVVGGPEDGRILCMSPGQTLGRYDDQPSYAPDIALYSETPVQDRQLSRRHLEWVGPGRVRMLRRGRVLLRMGGRGALPEGDRALIAGDLLRLTPGTALRAVL